MQIHIVVSQPLLGGQTRAESLVRGLGDAGLIEAERREELAQALDLILVRTRDMLEPPARTRLERAFAQACAHRRGFGRQMLGEQPEASTPFRQRLARLGEQPWNLANDRIPAAASATHPAGARQRDRAAPAARTGKHTRQWMGFRQRGNAGGRAARGQMSEFAVL